MNSPGSKGIEFPKTRINDCFRRSNGVSIDPGAKRGKGGGLFARTAIYSPLRSWLVVYFSDRWSSSRVAPVVDLL